MDNRPNPTRRWGTKHHLNMAKPAISILWLKRDLRWQDHTALQSALQARLPILAVYLKEPTQWAQIQYSDRQWQFVWDSVAAMNDVSGQQKVHASCCEAIEFFGGLRKRFEIKGIYSHQEVGIQWTFDRDLALAEWCNEAKHCMASVPHIRCGSRVETTKN